MCKLDQACAQVWGGHIKTKMVVWNHRTLAEEFSSEMAYCNVQSSFTMLMNRAVMVSREQLATFRCNFFLHVVQNTNSFTYELIGKNINAIASMQRVSNLFRNGTICTK